MSLTKVAPYLTQGSSDNKFTFDMIEGATLSLLGFPGADPTGVADSTSAINAALAQALATNTPLYLPAGEYKITGVVTLQAAGDPYLTGVKIIGAGTKQTVIKCYGSGFVQSAQDRVNDNIYVSDLSVVNVSSSANTGMDIGTVRGSTFENVTVNGFAVQWAVTVNRGVANWWNRFFNCEGSGSGAVGSVGWVLGNNGSATPISGLTNIPDLDYNDFYGCRSYSVEVGILIFNAIGCVISGHQVSACTTALQIYKGTNNDIQLNAELVTNMGFAQGDTRDNTLSLYNDGRLAADFVNDGVNYIENQVTGQTVLSNFSRTLDCFVQDRVSAAFTALSKNLFQIAFTSPDVAVTVTTTTCGYTVSTSEFASVQVWDITRTGGGAFVVTLIRTTGTVGVLTATADSGNVTWAIAGNATNLTVAQTVVNVQGIGVISSYPYMQNLGYLRT